MRRRTSFLVLNRVQSRRRISPCFLWSPRMSLASLLHASNDVEGVGYLVYVCVREKMTGEIGLLYTKFVPVLVPVLETFLKDDTPAVARQAITSGMSLFRTTLEKVAIKDLYSSELDDSIESSWVSMLNFKDMLYQIAFQRGSDGIRLLAVKFVEAIVLFYTPDPNGSSEPPPDQPFEGKIIGFDISWLRGGHSVLNVGDLSTEASQSLGLLLDQLRFPTVKSISNLMIIVLINSLGAVANKRHAFYGRIFPVLLGLDPSSSVNGT